MSALISIGYLLASVLFILGLKGLTHPRTAVQGNMFGACGMLLAVVLTLINQQILSYEMIILGLVIGGAIGAALAIKIEMTSMPELVAAFNGFGGIASVLVAGAADAHLYVVRTDAEADPHRLLARPADQLDVGDVDRHLLFDDAGRVAFVLLALVPFHHVQPLHNDPALFRQHLVHLALLATPLAGGDEHRVVALDFLHHPTSGAREMIFMTRRSPRSRAAGRGRHRHRRRRGGRAARRRRARRAVARRAGDPQPARRRRRGDRRDRPAPAAGLRPGAGARRGR